MSGLGATKVDAVIWLRGPIPDDAFDEVVLVLVSQGPWPALMAGQVRKQFPSDRPAFLPACSEFEMPVELVEWWARAPKGPTYLQRAEQ